MKTVGKRDLVAGTLAILTLLGFLCVFVAIIFHEIPVANKDYFNTALIALIGFSATGIGYYLGTSQSSADKNEIIRSILPTKGEDNEKTVLAVPPTTAGF